MIDIEMKSNDGKRYKAEVQVSYLVDTVGNQTVTKILIWIEGEET